MKKTLIILVFLFIGFSSYLTNAEDIRELQIEGIRLGDSLLDHFSEEEINNNLIEYFDYYEDKRFTTMELFFHPNFKEYENLQIHFKRNDSKYIVYAIYAANYYRKNIDQCYFKLDEVVDEISSLYKDLEKLGPDEQIHIADQTGQSISTGYYFWFDTGDYIAVECYDWSENVEWIDSYKFALSTREFMEWLKQ